MWPGVVNVSPYVAYSPLWIFSRSNVIDSSPGTRDINGEGDFVFTNQQQRVDRLTLGLRFITGAFNFTPEVTIAGGQQTYAVNLGADF